MSSRTLANTRSIEFINGCWQVLQASGEFHAIGLAGLPVSTFVSGWHPKLIIDFGVDIYALELMHENGQKATWFLDRSYNHLTDRVDLLSIELQKALLQPIAKWIKYVYDHLILQAEPDFKKEDCFTDHMNECTLRQFVDLLRQQEWFPCRILREQLFGHQTISVWPTKRLIELKCLDMVFQTPF